jgi:hypothetical protein
MVAQQEDDIGFASFTDLRNGAAGSDAETRSRCGGEK